MDIKSEPARVLRMKELAHKISFQPSTIYGLIAEGKFPAPFKIVSGGRVDELQDGLKLLLTIGSRTAKNTFKKMTQNKLTAR